MAHNFQLNEENDLLPNKQKKLPGGIIGWLMKRKIVSTPQQANVVLVLFIIIGLAAIIFINLRTFGS